MSAITLEHLKDQQDTPSGVVIVRCLVNLTPFFTAYVAFWFSQAAKCFLGSEIGG